MGSFGAEPLEIVPLPVTFAHVVSGRDTEDVIGCLLFGQARSGLSDDEDELTLEVHVRSAFGINDLGPGADDGARKLDEDTGVLSALAIAEMASVVEYDCDDFARFGRGEKLGARERR